MGPQLPGAPESSPGREGEDSRGREVAAFPCPPALSTGLWCGCTFQGRLVPARYLVPGERDGGVSDPCRGRGLGQVRGKPPDSSPRGLPCLLQGTVHIHTCCSSSRGPGSGVMPDEPLGLFPKWHVYSCHPSAATEQRLVMLIVQQCPLALNHLPPKIND